MPIIFGVGLGMVKALVETAEALASDVDPAVVVDSEPSPTSDTPESAPIESAPTVVKRSRKAPRAVDAPTAESVNVDQGQLQQQLEQLQAKQTENNRLLEAAEARAQAAELENAEAKERARVELLNKWGIKHPDYVTWAPSVSDGGDAQSDEGIATLARWRTEHPDLFAGAPKPPDVAIDDPADHYGNRGLAYHIKKKFLGRE